MAPRAKQIAVSWDQRRVDEGLYDACAAQLASMGPQALSAAVVDEHFQRAVAEKGNVSYVDVEGGAEARFNIIGEVAPMSMGTALSARGNYFAKPGMPMTDKDKVKDILVLRKPTLCTDALDEIFDYQIGALNEIREADEAEEKNQPKPVDAKEWLRASSPEDPSKPLDCMAVHLPLKYVTPPQATGKPLPVKPATRISRKRPASTTDEGSASGQEAAGDTDIKLGAFYKPQLNYDFGGPFFQLQRGMLAQHDVTGLDGKLVPPFHYYEQLKPGTLILANVSLHCWVYPEGPVINKFYQIHAHSIKILADSDEPVDLRQVPNLPPAPSTATSSASKSSFTGFSLTPATKKARK